MQVKRWDSSESKSIRIKKRYTKRTKQWRYGIKSCWSHHFTNSGILTLKTSSSKQRPNLIEKRHSGVSSEKTKELSKLRKIALNSMLSRWSPIGGSILSKMPTTPAQPKGEVVLSSVRMRMIASSSSLPSKSWTKTRPSSYSWPSPPRTIDASECQFLTSLSISVPWSSSCRTQASLASAE